MLTGNVYIDTFMKQTIVQSIGDSYPTGEETKALSFYNIAALPRAGNSHCAAQCSTTGFIHNSKYKKICKAFGGNLAQSRLKWHILTRSSTQRVAHLLPVECAVVWM